MRSRGTPICSAGTYCVPCAAGPPPPASGAGATGGGGGAVLTGAGPEDAGAAARAGAAAPPEMTASISCLLTLSPEPVPGTVVRSMPCSLAMRRTSGEEWTRVPSFAALAAGTTTEGCGAGGGTMVGFGAGAGAGAAAAAGADLAGAGAVAAAAEPAASITATTVLMGTVWPSLTLISFSTPADGAGISASTLSVEISKSGSSRSTLSPGFFSHLVIVPSKMLSPIWGITTSAAIFRLLEAYSETLDAVRRQDSCQVPGTPCSWYKTSPPW